MAPHTVKIHTPITLGIIVRTKPLVLKAEGAVRVGSILIARSTFLCLACPN
jgi:hypothetical protein